MKKHLSFLLLLLIHFLTGNAQQLNFSHYDVNDGLSQGNITCFMQDHLGLMWFGTWDGLNVYDGFKNKIYRERSSQRNSIKGVLINDILEIDSSKMAIASYTGLNIYYRQQDSFAFFKFKSGKNNTRIIRQYKNELRLLINNELVNFNLLSFKFQKDTSILSKQWKEINSSRKNGVNRSEYLFKRLFQLLENQIISTHNMQYILSSLTVNDMVHDSISNLLYLACDEGFYTYSINQKKISLKTIDGPIKCLIKFKHQIYIGSQNNGLYQYNLNEQIIESHYSYDEFSKKSITGNFIRTMFIDRKRNLWVSVLGSGVNYCNLNAQPCTSILTYEDFPLKEKQNKYIHAIAEDKEGNLWVASVTGKLFELDHEYKILKTITPAQIDPSRNSLLIQQIYIDELNTIYLITENGLYISLNQSSFKHISIPNHTSNQRYMQSIIPLNDSLLLIGTREGLLRFNKKNNQISTENELNESTIHTIFKDSKGHIFINPFFNGFTMYEFDQNQLRKKFQLADDFNVKSLYSKNDTAWFATTNGILCLNTQTFSFKIWDEDNGLPNQNIYCLLPDEHEVNSFWSSSNRGIFRYNTKTQRALFFGLNEGLSSLEFNTYAFAKRKNGDYVFGSIDGLTYLNPNNLALTNQAYLPILTNFQVDHLLPYHFHSSHQSNELVIPFDHNNFSCRLIQINFPNSSNALRYKLTGYDKEWIQANNPIEIHYSNIREGKYQLLAQYLDQEKGWQTISFYSIEILSPWYRTWWAYLLYLVSSSAILFTILSLYVRKKIQEKNEAQRSSELLLKERDRISADLHDDIGSTLSSIAIYNELINDKVKTKPELVPQLSEKISIQINSLMRHTEDIIWSLKIGQNQHEPLSKRIQEYSTELLHSKQIQSTIEIENNVENILRHPEQRRNMLMIIKEAMNNCRKYSNANHFTINMFMKDQLVTLILKDDGIGFDNDKIVFGDGILNIQNRCLKMNGTCEIKSIIGEGTVIHCNIPISSYIK